MGFEIFNTIPRFYTFLKNVYVVPNVSLLTLIAVVFIVTIVCGLLFPWIDDD